MTPLEKFLSEAKEQRERFKNSKEIIPIPILFSHSLQSQAKMEKIISLMLGDHMKQCLWCNGFRHAFTCKLTETLNKIAESK